MKKKIFTIITLLVISIAFTFPVVKVSAACSEKCTSTKTESNCSAPKFGEYILCVYKSDVNESNCSSKKASFLSLAQNWFDYNKKDFCTRNYNKGFKTSDARNSEFMNVYYQQCKWYSDQCTQEGLDKAYQTCLNGNGRGTNSLDDYTSRVNYIYKCDGDTDNGNNGSGLLPGMNQDSGNGSGSSSGSGTVDHSQGSNNDISPSTGSGSGGTATRNIVNSAGGVGVSDLTGKSYELKIYNGSPCQDSQIALAVSVIAKVVDIIKIVVPIILVIIAIVDITKAVLAQEDNKKNKSIQQLVKRIISAVIVFFVVIIVQLICGLVGTNSTDAKCMEIISSPWNY